MSTQGQSVTLGGPNEGPLVAPLQKLGVLPERAILRPFERGDCRVLYPSMAYGKNYG